MAVSHSYLQVLLPLRERKALAHARERLQIVLHRGERRAQIVRDFGHQLATQVVLAFELRHLRGEALGHALKRERQATTKESSLRWARFRASLPAPTGWPLVKPAIATGLGTARQLGVERHHAASLVAMLIAPPVARAMAARALTASNARHRA